MTQKREYILIRVAFALIFMSMLALAMWLTPVAEAGLPIRDTPTPTPVTAKDKDKDDSGPIGAWVELQALGMAHAWSSVQWQNSAGTWENVDGWQGSLDESGNRRWWVAEKDFGDGPFRWVVTQDKNGPALGVSEPFALPTGASETVRIVVNVQ
jgi:hypothetical protein